MRTLALGKNNKDLLAVADPKKTLHRNLDFASLEQYKLLRANLSFTLPEDVKCPIIGVTSSMRGEGKSTTAINLAYVLAESGKSVLLIDADLRLPSIAKKMGIRSNIGLTNLLLDPEGQNLSTFKTNILDNWYIIPSGDLPPNPSELLGSKKMFKLLQVASEMFDFVILDLPPVNVVSDTLAVSHYVTGMLVVVREDYTEKKELNECIRQLKLSEVKVFGCVMNATKSVKGKYKKYRYKGSSQSYRYQDAAARKDKTLE